MLKFPKLQRARSVARIAERRSAWAHSLWRGKRRTSDFNPASIAGLRVWLKADDLARADNSPVSLWRDVSDSGNSVAQATGMKMPTCKAIQLGGKPVVRFDGVDDTLFKTGLSGFVCNHGHTVIALLNPTSTSPFRMAVV